MKTISTQKNVIRGLRKAMEGGIELLRYTGKGWGLAGL